MGQRVGIRRWDGHKRSVTNTDWIVLEHYSRIDKTQNYQNIELNLIGHGNVEESETIIKSLSKRKTEVNYLGAISQDKLAVFLRTCDVFILPSFFEGLPLVVIEALASGVKVICTDLPGLDEFMGEELKALGAIRYVKMPRLKNVDTPYAEDIEAFERELSQKIDDKPKAIILNPKINTEINIFLPVFLLIGI